MREILKGRVQDAAPVPSFPEPSRPKSRTPVKFSVLTPSNVEAKCLNVKGRMCVLLLGSSSPSSVDIVSEVARPLARAFRLDKLSFGYIAGGSDLSPVLRPAFGLPPLSEEADALQVVVVKTGKRKRFAVFDMKSPLTDASAMVGDLTAFLNDVMGGMVRFTKFQVPELPAVSEEPPNSAATRDQPPVDDASKFARFSNKLRELEDGHLLTMCPFSPHFEHNPKRARYCTSSCVLASRDSLGSTLIPPLT